MLSVYANRRYGLICSFSFILFSLLIIAKKKGALYVTPHALFRLLKTIISPHAPYFALFVLIVFIG
ncbi:hypothetical protein C2S42_07270 [Helicobacter pylori]|nr:hypothetical protein C2S42_07270 [Helicobacter pylori]